MQLIATVLAAVTGALLASSLGVVGTIAGTAVASAASNVATAVYRHYLGRTRERIREVAPVIVRRAQWRPSAGPQARAAERVDVVDVPVERSGNRRAWPRYGLPALAAFVLVIGCITGFELIAGKPISSVVWGKSGNGTSIGSLFSGHKATPATDPTSSTQPSSGASSSSAGQASSEPSSPSVSPTAATSTGSPAQSATPQASNPAPAPAASNAATPAG